MKKGKKKVADSSCFSLDNEVGKNDVSWYISEVVSDLGGAGYKVTFGPIKKEAWGWKEPVYGYIEKSGKVVGLIAGKCMPPNTYKMPKNAKTCISAMSTFVKFNEVLCSLFKDSSYIYEYKFSEGLKKLERVRLKK
jgi:hypothetical protein